MMKYLVIIYLVSLLISVAELADVSTGKKGIVYIDEAGVCKMDYKESKAAASLKDLTKDKKGLDATLDFPSELSDKFLLYFNLDKKVPGGWLKDFMKYVGPACNKTVELLPGVLKKLSDLSSPKFDIRCPWKKAVSSVKDFPTIVDSKDLNLPTYPYGQFKFTYLIKDPMNKRIFCLELYVTVKKP